jgi:hypothetical protein
MSPPPTKPFVFVFLGSLGLFIVWGIIGSILEPQIADPATQQKIGRVVLPIAFGLFLIMGFSAVPVMVKVFLKLFFGMQRTAGDLSHPFIRKLQENQNKISAVIIYAFWTIYTLGALIAAPFFFRDFLK